MNTTFSGPFTKTFYGNSRNIGAGPNSRTADNPAFPTPYSSTVPNPLRRIYLVIQNIGTTEVDINFTSNGSDPNRPVIKLYAGQSISLDNYNGPFILSGSVITNINILEAFN